MLENPSIHINPSSESILCHSALQEHQYGNKYIHLRKGLESIKLYLKLNKHCISKLIHNMFEKSDVALVYVSGLKMLSLVDHSLRNSCGLITASPVYAKSG